MSEKVKFTAVIVQGSAALIIGSLTALTGLVFAWQSYTFKIYQSNNTVLDAPITTAQVSMLGSIINVGALIAMPFCGYAVDKIGRKYFAMLLGFPYVVSWTLISVATSFYVLFAVGLADFGAAGQAVSSVYIAEISQDSIRRALTSSTVYGFLFGLLSSYVFGGYMSYYKVLYLHMALSILYIILLMHLKEFPCYLLKSGKEKTLMTSTSILSGIFTILIGTLLHLHWAPHWFTAFTIYGFSFVFNLGAAIVPFVLTAEVFLPEVRGLGCSLAMATLWIMNWVTLIIFNPLVEACGLGPTFYVFSFICFLGAVYSHLFFSETKGLSADQIQILFIKKKINNAQKA